MIEVIDSWRGGWVRTSLIVIPGRVSERQNRACSGPKFQTMESQVSRGGPYVVVCYCFG